MSAMLHNTAFLALLTTLWISSVPVRGQREFLVTSISSSSLPVTESAEFRCRFLNRWTRARHPAMFPENAHWSRPVVVAHGPGYQMWAPGTLASAGVERVAESGSTAAIRNEISSSQDTGDSVIGRKMFNSSRQRQRFRVLTMDPEYPLMSTITMMAPSPDWFTGFYNFDARNLESSTWYSEFTIETFPWDAGTERGDEYRKRNPRQVPQSPISQLAIDTVPENGILRPPEGEDEVLTVGRWICTLQNDIDVIDETMDPIPETTSFIVAEKSTSGISASTDSVEYSCVFRNMWSALRHPIQYPSDAHWSSPVLAAHDEGYQMWEPGSLSSLGVESVAETGSTIALRSELGGSTNVSNFVVGSVTFNRFTQRQTLGDVTADPDHPYLSSITMIAPSPDWFSGFFDFDTRDSETGNWYSSFAIETFPWDAGTESGETYSTGGRPENPLIPIFQLTIDTIPENGILADRDGANVLPVARWECSLFQ